MTNTTNRRDDMYWFADPDSKAVVQAIAPMMMGGVNWASNAMQQVWYRNMLFYYSAILKPENWDTGLNFGGVQGELLEMIVPMARSLTRQMVSIVTKQKLAFTVVSDSNAADVIKTSRIGNSLVKHIITSQGLDTIYENMYEHGLLTGLGFIFMQWRTDKGEFYTRDEMGRDHFTGDLQVTTPTIFDVAFDSTVPDPRNWQWAQVRVRHNRWDLIAQFPELKEALLKVPSCRQQESRMTVNYDITPSDDDMIYVYNMFHDKSPALPEGRYLAYASDEAILFDGPNFYGEIPLYTARAEPVIGSSYGYPYFSNLLGLQEMFDNTISTIATNHSTFGVQNVAVPRGSNIDVAQILGMNFIQYTPQDAGGGGVPVGLNLTQISPESWKFAESLKGLLTEMSMVNSALRGDPPTGVTSGAAIATLTTNALESVAASAKAARETLRRSMIGAINIYKRMASVERKISVPFAGAQSYDSTFTGEDLYGISDIDIVEINPIMQTQSGREMVADKLMQQGLVTNVKGYFSILEGAPPSELYENELSQADLVRMENEALALGTDQVVVLNTDDHAYHVMMHSIDLNNMKTRRDPERSQRILAHILQHYEQAKGMDPFLAAMIQTGKMPMRGMPQGGAPGGAPGAQPPAGLDQAGNPAEPANPAQDMLGRDQGQEVA